MRSSFFMLVLLAGCGDPYEGWPDLRARYNVQLVQTEGCPQAPEHVSWVAGPLIIAGELPDLTFDFGQDMVFDGTTTETGSFSFRGPASAPETGTAYTVAGSGGSTGTAPNLQLEGSVDVQIDGAEDGCIYTGVIRAPQVGS